MSLSVNTMIYAIFSNSRSLTKRQRDLLQLYADDVDGRASQNPVGGSGDTNERDTNSTEGSKGSESNSNGTNLFNEPKSSTSMDESGWVSRTWQRFRRRIGL